MPKHRDELTACDRQVDAVQGEMRPAGFVVVSIGQRLGADDIGHARQSFLFFLRRLWIKYTTARMTMNSGNAIKHTPMVKVVTSILGSLMSVLAVARGLNAAAHRAPDDLVKGG